MRMSGSSSKAPGAKSALAQKAEAKAMLDKLDKEKAEKERQARKIRARKIRRKNKTGYQRLENDVGVAVGRPPLVFAIDSGTTIEPPSQRFFSHHTVRGSFSHE